MQVKVKWLSGLLVVLLVLGLSGCMVQQHRMKYYSQIRLRYFSTVAVIGITPRHRWDKRLKMQG